MDTHKKKPDFVRRFVYLSAAFLVFWVLYVSSQTRTGGYVPSASSSPNYSDPNQQALWIASGKEAIKSRLKDPDSAEFRGVAFNLADMEGKSIPVACGEVNSKNSFGGYTGYKKFVAAGSQLAVTEEDVSDFHNVWNKLCVD